MKPFRRTLASFLVFASAPPISALGKSPPPEAARPAQSAPQFGVLARFLAATRTGQSPSPSFEDGMRAQAVLDAVLESIASGGRMVSI